MGDIRADGFIFQCYAKKRLKSGEIVLRAQWRSPEKMEKWRVCNRLAQKAWYLRKKAERKARKATK
jgi:hypothetical protein